MYDELIKQLREDAEWVKTNCWETPITLPGHLKQAADAIEELSKPHLIPVTEEPPLKAGDDGYNGYLVYANGYYKVADYTTDKFDNVPYFHVDGEYEQGVTHFMPLPEPPKEET